MAAAQVDDEFVRALPKAELHAHLTGSISRKTLHSIWESKRSEGQCLDLEDPLTAIQPGGDFVDVISFFPLFDRYIYALVNDVETVKLATRSVIADFAADGVVYLELRTTPRENTATRLTKEAYVAAVHDVVSQHNVINAIREGGDGVATGIEVRLILSVDRKMTVEQAESVVDLALRYRHPSRAQVTKRSTADGEIMANENGQVVALDLCGNPARGDMSIFTPAFRRAKAHGLGITVHFAELPQSGYHAELETLLSWEPDRLSHVIHVGPEYKRIIEERRLGLELCLSCNVLAKLTTGGFAMHHFREWWKTGCPIALSVSCDGNITDRHGADGGVDGRCRRLR